MTSAVLSHRGESKKVGAREAAEILGITLGTLMNYRSLGIGPPDAGVDDSRRPGRARVLYDIDQLAAWQANSHCSACGQELPLNVRSRRAFDPRELPILRSNESASVALQALLFGLPVNGSVSMMTGDEWTRVMGDLRLAGFVDADGNLTEAAERIRAKGRCAR